MIHKDILVEKLQELGIPKWVDVGEILKSYDPDIKTRQIKRKMSGYLSPINRYGYDWHLFFPTWNTYLSEKEKRDVEVELGIDVAEVARVAVNFGAQTERDATELV